VYVLEANPRSSRTVPFVSKSTGVPIAKLAAKVMTDDLTLADLDVDEQIPEHRSVKEGRPPVRPPAGIGPAARPGDEVDRRSDGDGPLVREGVRQGAGLDEQADPRVRYRRRRPLGRRVPGPGHRGRRVPRRGVRRALRELSEATDLIEAAKRGEIDLIVSRQRELLLEVAVEEEITYFSTHASAKAALEAIDHKGDDLDVMAVSDRPKRVENWGRRRVDGGSTSGLSTSDTVYKRPRDRGDRL